MDTTIQIDGLPVHYVDAGRGPTLLFVHGAPGWSFTWRGVIANLEATFRCVAPDLPGFGLSPAGVGPASVRAGAQTLERFASALNLQDVTLIANDTGDSVGFGAAGRMPGRIRGLVAAGTFGFTLDEFPQVRRALRIFSSGPASWVNRTFNLIPRTVLSFGTPGKKWSREERRAYLAPFRDKAMRRRTSEVLRSLVDDPAYLEEVQSSLGRLKDRPLLALYGEHDKAAAFGFPDKFARLFPDYTFHSIPGASHFPQEDAAPALASHIAAWFAERVAPGLSPTTHLRSAS
jgi:haloalkane dehalogenase